jgi:hypothetical protein
MSAAVALGVASIVTQLGGGALSFGQAAQQKRMQREAETKANQYLAKAREQIERQRMEEVQLPLKQRQLTEKARAVGMKQALEAFQETGPRAVIGGVPKAQQVDVAARAQEQAQTEQQLFQREEAIAKAKTQQDLALANIELMGAQGAAQAAADAQRAAAAGVTGGFTALGGALQAGSELVPLYQQTALSEQVSALTGQAGSGEAMAGVLQQAQQTGAITQEQFNKLDLSALQGKTGFELNQLLQDQFSAAGISAGQLKGFEFNPNINYAALSAAIQPPAASQMMATQTSGLVS